MKSEKNKEKQIIYCESVLDLLSALGERDNNTYLYHDGGILLAFDNEKGMVKEVNNYEET